MTRKPETMDLIVAIGEAFAAADRALSAYANTGVRAPYGTHPCRPLPVTRDREFVLSYVASAQEYLLASHVSRLHLRTGKPHVFCTNGKWKMFIVKEAHGHMNSTAAALHRAQFVTDDHGDVVITCGQQYRAAMNFYHA